MRLETAITPLILFITLLISSCSKSTTEEEIPVSTSETLDISYGDHSANILDLYLPANRNINTKTVILVHGGFWAQGDKKELTAYAKLLQSQGFAVANINYRLTGTAENIHPAQVTDIKKAVDFISTTASEWQIASDKIGLVGASAGAHISLLYTYAYNTNDKVKTVVSIAGPTDLTDSRNINAVQRQAVALLIGSTIEANPAAYNQASPITHIKASTKPTLMIHGKKDKLVPYQQAVDCKNKLDQFNVTNKLISYEDLGHDNIINQQNNLVVLQEIVGWLNTHIR